jgi:hypothetical protein
VPQPTTLMRAHINFQFQKIAMKALFPWNSHIRLTWFTCLWSTATCNQVPLMPVTLISVIYCFNLNRAVKRKKIYIHFQFVITE